MPTYDYRCDACDHAFELFQQMTARSKRTCPACGERRLRRLVGTGAGVIFKGSGFYQTDYRSESYRKAADAEKTAMNGEGKKKTKEGKDKSATADGKAKKAGTSKKSPSADA